MNIHKMKNFSAKPTMNSSLQNNEDIRQSKPPENRANGQTNGQQNEKVGGAKDMMHGFTFQNQMALYYIIRGLNIASKTDDFTFKISTELESAGKFNDIIFHYGTSKFQKYRLIQIKHKSSKNEAGEQKTTPKNITIANLFRNIKDDFRLAQYFLSYLTMKNEFAESVQRIQKMAYKNDPVEYFIFTTNSSFEPSLFNEMFERIPDPLLDKCNLYQFKGAFLRKSIKDLKHHDPDKWYIALTKKFSGNTKIIDTILYDTDVMKFKTIRKEVELTKFLQLLKFSCNNPDGILLENIIKEEICKYFKWNASEEIINTAYKTILKQDIFDWMAERHITTISMSDAADIFAKIINKNLFVISDDFKNSVFIVSQIEFCPESNVYEQFLNGSKKILNIVGQTGTRMSLLKLIHHMANREVIFVSDRIISRHKDHIACALRLKTIDFVVIECRIQTVTTEINDILEEIKKIKRDTPKIILLSSTEMFFPQEMKCSDIFDQIYENNEFFDLTQKSQKIILDEYVIFQGYDVQLSKITDESCGDILKNKVLCQLLSNKDILIGEAIKPDDETDEHYIERRLEHENFSSDILLKDLFAINEKIVLISSEPGMGKTSLLKHLAYSTKLLDNSTWVVLLELNKFTEYFNKQTDFSFNEALELLLYAQNFHEDFEKDLFRKCIHSENNKIIILIDAFDEIGLAYRQRVLNFITHLKNTNVKSIWITTRPQEKRLLEKEFNIKAYSISPFSKEEQKEFLAKFWKKDINDNRVSSYVNKLLRTTKESITDNERQLTGIPLMTKMFAQTYADQFNNFYENSCEITDTFQPFNILQLYERFIENKFDTYLIQKLNIDYSKSGIEELKELVYIEFINNHKLLSIYVLFKQDLEQLLNKEQINMLEILKNKIIIGGGNFGIIYNSNHQLIFKHRTFAEYFAAKWFIDKCISSEKVNSYLKIHMLKPEMEIVRHFFDYMSATHDIHRTILQNDLTITEKLLNDVTLIDLTDNFGRTPLHLMAIHNCKHIASICIQKNINSIQKKDVLFGWSPLKYACIVKSWDFLDLYVERNLFDLDLLDYIDVTKVMHEVELNGCYHLLKLLRNKLKSITNVNKANDVRLHSAIILEQIENFETLLNSHSTLVNATDLDNRTPLYYAIIKGYNNVVQLLINAGADINCYDAMNTTPLILAAEKGNLEIIKLLINGNATVNVRDNHDMTPLLAAVFSGNIEIVKYLIEKGAQINLTDLNQPQILINSTINSHIEILKYLQSLGVDIINWTNVNDKWTLLHFAACAGNIKIIEYLCYEGAETNAESNDKESALHICARHDNVEIIEILINHGADINVRSISSLTPLHFATVHGNLNVVNYLIKQGINVNARTVGKKTALHLAAVLNFPDIVTCLIDSNSEINALDEKNKTPLICAIENGSLDSLKILLEKGADIKTKCDCQKTPLIYASSNGHLEIVRVLSDSGVNIESMDINQRTSLHYAVISNHLHIVKFLTEKGANIHALDCNKNTPLMIALHNEFNDIIEYLQNIQSEVNINSFQSDGEFTISNETEDH